MKPIKLRSPTAKALTLVSGTAVFLTLLSQPAWAGAKKTPFTAMGPLAGIALPGGITFIDFFPDGTPKTFYAIGLSSYVPISASDPRYSGMGTNIIGIFFDLPMSPGPEWARSCGASTDGAWDGYWTGGHTAFTDSTGDHLLTRTVGTSVGSGANQGLVSWSKAETVDAAQNNNPVHIEGYILEAKGGPGEVPLEYRSEGTERVEMHPGVFLTPEPMEPGVMVTWKILDEVAQVSHLGRCVNEGLGLLETRTGEVSGMGVLTSANGDKLSWVATGKSPGPNGPVDLTLHWAGGTGRFEAAVGQIQGVLELKPTADPAVMQLTFKAKGTIRY